MPPARWSGYSTTFPARWPGIDSIPATYLALYSDGITESFNASEEDFGEARLVDAVARHRSLPACELAHAIVDEVMQFSGGAQFDDVTLIVAKRGDNSGA